jgi:AAA domain/UvrD-like helicase C-terminal domain
VIKTIVFADTFNKTVAKFDNQLKLRVFEFMVKFSLDPDADGINLKPPTRARDPRVRVARVTQDYRAVLFYPGSGAVYFLLNVLHHDDAYAYAAHAKLDVNKVTGGLEILELDRIEAARDEYRATAQAPGAPPLLFAGVGDADLRRLGISDDILPLVRMLTADDQLLGLTAIIPQVQADVLLTLYDGSPAEDVYADVVAPYLDGRPVDVDDLDAALERPATLISFTVTTNDDDLRAALDWPMDRWRTYLHPTQRTIAYPARPYGGPFRITGGPGTGKTVVAVHRARALAAKAKPDERILMAAFNTNIAATLKDLLRRLGGDTLADRVDVKTVDQLAMGVVYRAEGTRPPVLTDSAVLEQWNEYLVQHETGFSARFLDAEWNQVILAHALHTRDDYLATPRTGRGARRIGPAQRAEIWTLISGFEARLRGLGRRTFRQIATDAARYAGASSKPTYRHIIVDEAQDLHASHWRLLRALAPIADDDLFLAGDPFQRIYDNRVVLGRCGIRIQGRAKRLTINYRTTRQILDSSLALMRDHRTDDLDGGSDNLHGYRSLMRGAAPHVAGYPDLAAELAALGATVTSWHKSGIDYDDIAVGTRSRALVAIAHEALLGANIPAFVLTGKTQDAGQAGVRVTTLHRLKGMEFRCVALTALGAGQIPQPRDLADTDGDPSASADLLVTERSLLFVAGTRARDALAVSWHGEHSPLIAPLVRAHTA